MGNGEYINAVEGGIRCNQDWRVWVLAGKHREIESESSPVSVI